MLYGNNAGNSSTPQVNDVDHGEKKFSTSRSLGYHYTKGPVLVILNLILTWGYFKPFFFHSSSDFLS